RSERKRTEDSRPAGFCSHGWQYERSTFDLDRGPDSRFRFRGWLDRCAEQWSDGIPAGCWCRRDGEQRRGHAAGIGERMELLCHRCQRAWNREHAPIGGHGQLNHAFQFQCQRCGGSLGRARHTGGKLHAVLSQGLAEISLEIFSSRDLGRLSRRLPSETATPAKTKKSRALAGEWNWKSPKLWTIRPEAPIKQASCTAPALSVLRRRRERPVRRKRIRKARTQMAPARPVSARTWANSLWA